MKQLHEAWKAGLGFPEHTLGVGYYSAEAEVLAEAIDGYGLEACLLVAEHAKLDGMVSGKRDRTGSKHDSIRYIFSNPDTFNRILRDARERDRTTSKKRPASELVREAERL